MKREAYIVILAVLLISLPKNDLFATSLDELDHPLLNKGQLLLSPSYDVNYSSYDFDTYTIYPARRTELDYDWSYWKNTFGIDALYGLNNSSQLRFGAKYNLNYNYDFSYTQYDSSTSSAGWAWEDTEVKYYLPFQIDAGLKLRLSDAVEEEIYYKYERYNTDTHIRYGTSPAVTAADKTETSNSYSQELNAKLTYLSGPHLNRDKFLRSDLDGILHPLLEKDELRIDFDVAFLDENLGYRYYKDNYDRLSTEKTQRISFGNSLTGGLTDSVQARVDFRYYLPYDHRVKLDYYTIGAYYDYTFKYHDAYDIGGNIRERFTQNLDLSMDCFFQTWRARGSNDHYYYSGNGVLPTYPFNYGMRKNLYKIRAGGTYLTDAKKDRGKLRPNLEGLNRPLLEKNQFMASAFFNYQLFLWNAHNEAEPNLLRYRYTGNSFSIDGRLTYGITDKLEANIGAVYEFPYKAKEARYDNDNGNPLFAYTYDFPLKFEIDSEIIYRPSENLDFSIKGGYTPSGEIPYQFEPPHRYIYSGEEILSDVYSQHYTTNRILKFSTYFLTVRLRYLM